MLTEWPGSSNLLGWIVVAVFGTLVGLGELISRYRDAPLRAIVTGSALLYMGLNAAAAIGALALILLFDVQFGIDPTQKPNQLFWTRILVAGLGAMAFFRSSLFTVRVADQDIGVGPSSFLQVMLDASDRGVDRLRAESRASEVVQAMKDISFQKAYASLPTLCLELMQNVSVQQQAVLAEDVEKLKKATFDENSKALVLGLKLMNVVGKGVLLGAVNSLGPRIRTAHDLELPLTVTLAPATEYQLIPKVYDGAKLELPIDGLVWSSGNKAVVQVDGKGRILAQAEGKTIVSATLDGITRYVEVQVAKAVPPTARNP
jgi:hypothetical protein